MAQDTTPERWSAAGEPPSEVEITVVVGPRGRALRERIADIFGFASAHVIVGLAFALAVVGAIVTGVLQGDGNGARPGTGAPQSRREATAGVAAAYGYPLRCLSITIAANDAAYARADFDHASPCGRYDGYPTAIFRRVDGTWRRLLDTVSYSCPVPSLPAAVQGELDVCPQGTTPLPARLPARPQAADDRPRSRQRPVHAFRRPSPGGVH